MITEKEKIKVEYREFELMNGLRVIMSANKNLPYVAVNSTFHVGSKDDPEGKKGIAHLWEHLMFEGKIAEKLNFDEILNKFGGDSNAYTNWDMTGYYLTLPADALELGIWLDSSRLAGFRISESDMEIQKQVVIEEKLQIHDNTPYGSAEEESSKRLFTNSGYKYPVIGDVGNITGISLGDLKNFYSGYYVPNNAVLSIAGDIDYAKTEKFVKKYYSGIPRGIDIERQEFSDKYSGSEICEVIPDNVSLPGTFIYYRIPKVGTRDYYAFLVLNNILSSGNSSRLYMELVYNNKIASDAESYVYGMEKTSLLEINVISMMGRSNDDILMGIDNVLDGILSGGVTERELKKAVNKSEMTFYGRLWSNVYISEKLSETKILFGDCERIYEELETAKELDSNDVRKVAEKYLKKNQRVVLNYIPLK